MNNNEILSVRDIHAAYFKREVLKGLSLSVMRGDILAIIGPNGSGKSTLLKVISGVLPPHSGEIKFNNVDVTNVSARAMIQRGIGYFIQGGEVFSGLSVYKNLILGGIDLEKSKLQSGMQDIFELFPKLNKLRNRRAGLMSGGEKQALALAMVLIRKPSLLLLDEPSAGLSPALVKQVLNMIREINLKYNMTIMLVEQNIKEALNISNRVYLLKNGQIIGEEKPHALLEGERINALFFS